MIPVKCETCRYWKRNDQEIGECNNDIVNEEETLEYESCTLHEHDEKRRCYECGDVMWDGYCIEAGLAYYCSDECLEKNMSRAEYLSLYENGNGDSYWTEWEDDGSEDDFLNVRIR